MFWFLRKPSGVQTAAVTAVESTTASINVGGYAGGVVTVTAGITLLTLYGSHTENGTYLPYYDEDDVPITVVVASTKITEIPPDIYNLTWVKFVANTSGTVTATFKS